MSTTATDRASLVRAVTEQHLSERGPLMPVLHDVMEEFGTSTVADVAAIADVLNLSVAEVHGVVSFYNDFRTTPPPAHVVALCRGEACQAVGAEALYDHRRAPQPPEPRRRRRGGARCSASATARSARPAPSTARLHGRLRPTGSSTADVRSGAP